MHFVAVESLALYSFQVVQGIQQEHKGQLLFGALASWDVLWRSLTSIACDILVSMLQAHITASMTRGPAAQDAE